MKTELLPTNIFVQFQYTTRREGDAIAGQDLQISLREPAPNGQFGQKVFDVDLAIRQLSGFAVVACAGQTQFQYTMETTSESLRRIDRVLSRVGEIFDAMTGNFQQPLFLTPQQTATLIDRLSSTVRALQEIPAVEKSKKILDRNDNDFQMVLETLVEPLESFLSTCQLHPKIRLEQYLSDFDARVRDSPALLKCLEAGFELTDETVFQLLSTNHGRSAARAKL